MALHLILVVALAGSLTLVSCFQFQLQSSTIGNQLIHLQSHSQEASRTTTSLHAKQRKTKKRVTNSRPNSFYDKTSDLATDDKPPATAAENEIEAQREARKDEAVKRFEQRPEVSSLVIDEETGVEILVQGKTVMDVVTRKPVKLSKLGPVYRLAQMFPGVPPDVREKHRLDWNNVQVEQVVEALRNACSVKLENGNRGIPPHPSVANKAIDFVLANRDRMGRQMKSTLGRLTLRSMSDFNKEQASANQQLWRNYLTIENHISAPFRQMVLDAEGRVGPNFGNLDLMSYCNGDLYERCANYVVLKGMVAHWEKKVVDADYVEKNPRTKDNYVSMLSRGDPRRYLPDPPILFSLRECTQVCLMSQTLTKQFVETSELFDDFPPELKFLEAALSIRGGTGLRQFVVEEFCPANDITPAALREGMRRLLAQLDSLQIDPYADICNLLESLIIAMSRGTEDEQSPFRSVIANTDTNGPGYFQTYTFNHNRLSFVRFLDQQYDGEAGEGGDNSFGENPFSNFMNMGQNDKKKSAGGNFFDFGDKPLARLFSMEDDSLEFMRSEPTDDDEDYKVPPLRALGRPHELGWLELLDEETQDSNNKLNTIPAGTIVADEE
ncbi:hypothetical protein MPSEU_000294300 [Mayamaea pseudoterrestris]|nr:hypothetical protein MPSEU_000294300 [Mayamaea pseudoterrestris]